jgi:trimeric autotransporter adhesin
MRGGRAREVAAAGITAPATPTTSPTGSLASLSPSPHTLQVLNVSGNPLGGWGALHALAQLPSLSRLLASGCGFTAAFADVGSAAVELSTGSNDAAATAAPPSAASVPLPHSFQSVESLTLGGGNAFSSVASVDALDSAFPRLTSLRLGHADLAFGAGSEIDAEAVARAAAVAAGGAPSAPPASAQPSLPPLGPSEARQLLVARLPRLASLNGSDVRPKERADAEKTYARRLGGAFAQAWAAATAAVAATAAGDTPAVAPSAPPRVTDVFGCKSAALPPQAYISAPHSGDATADRRSSTASDAAASVATSGGRSGFGGGEELPAAFRRAGDGGVIRSHAAAAPVPYPHAPVPVFAVSCPVEWAERSNSNGGSSVSATAASLHGGSPPLTAPPYVSALDPCGLGAGNPAAAGALQRAWPRYFIVAAEHDLHAVPSVSGDAGTGSLASTVVTVTLRSIAGASCTMEPLTKRLPLSMTVGAFAEEGRGGREVGACAGAEMGVLWEHEPDPPPFLVRPRRPPLPPTAGSLKQLAGRLFKAADLSAVRLSWQEAGVSSSFSAWRAVPTGPHTSRVASLHPPCALATPACTAPLQSSYPLPLDDDMKPLSYYGITAPLQQLSSSTADGNASTAGAAAAATAAAAASSSSGEIIMEEVDPAEVARKAAEAAAAEAARAAAQAAMGDALRRAADADHRRVVAPAPPAAAAASQGGPGRA